MSDTMHLICLKDTGHVLAALAATTAGDAPALADVVGEQLHLASVRSTENGTDGLPAATTRVPASLLELKSVPLDTRVIANPLHHAVDGGRVVRMPPVAGPPAADLTQSTITLNGGTPDTKGLAVVDRAGDAGGDQLRVQAGKFVDPDADGVSDALALPLSALPDDTPAGIEGTGSYDIFVALEGMRPYWAIHAFP